MFVFVAVFPFLFGLCVVVGDVWGELVLVGVDEVDDFLGELG